MSYPIHKLALMFPPANETDFESLERDIKENGQVDDIILYEGHVLDGRHRQEACTALGINPRYSEFAGDETAALKFVISKNLHRRHLTPSQRSMIAARLANVSVGGDRRSEHSANLQNDKVSQSDAAEKLKVSTRSVASAKKVLSSNDETLIASVDKGSMSVSAAANLADAIGKGFMSAVAAKIARGVEAAKVQKPIVEPEKPATQIGSAVARENDELPQVAQAADKNFSRIEVTFTLAENEALELMDGAIHQTNIYSSDDPRAEFWSKISYVISSTAKANGWNFGDIEKYPLNSAVF